MKMEVELNLDTPAEPWVRVESRGIYFVRAYINPHKTRMHVSFYWDCYRWSGWVKNGESKFTATKTKDYQYVTGGSHRPNQQIRMDKAARNTQRRHRQPLG